MSKIVFRGKTYNSVFEMPNDIRQAYQIEKRKRPAETGTSKPLTDYVDMSDRIREIYERALGKVEDRTASSQPAAELPKIEDIYRQSASPRISDSKSDEKIYSPSPPLVPPSNTSIEPDNGARRLAMTLAVLILLAGIAFFVVQYMS